MLLQELGSRLWEALDLSLWTQAGEDGIGIFLEWAKMEVCI